MLIVTPLRLRNSIASSSGKSLCVSTSLITTFGIGRKFASPGVGVTGKDTMFVAPSGNLPSDEPGGCAIVQLTLLINTPEAVKIPSDSLLAESRKFVWSAPAVGVLSASKRWKPRRPAPMNDNAGIGYFN